ncbi:MAG: hypothetical protein HOV79_25945 [Hamadaea sp.]|nr:hypothetical protein [Hamadaea sp.]
MRRQPGDFAHLEWFARSKYGVEAYIEPQTIVTQTTVILIAHDGEWTRRRIGSPQDAWRWGRSLNIPVYDVHLTGYPQRMRDYNARQRKAGAA